jgi:hypothetical protein
VPELIVGLPGLPPTGPALGAWMRAASAVVASGWSLPPVDGSVFADIVVPEVLAGRWWTC